MASDFSRELHPVLKAYADAVHCVVHDKDFGSAETVARKMRVVFGASNDPYIKTLALKAILIAAVDLNRYAVQ